MTTAATKPISLLDKASLSDHDITVLRQVLTEGLRRNDQVLLGQTVQRVLELTGIPGPIMQPAPWFLSTVLRDHIHLAGQQEAAQ